MAKTKKNRKYIFVVGGVMSGVGKGVTTSSIGLILKSRGFSVTNIKIDPYVNVDAGTMNPTEHGEVFVLDDGYETDQDMGNYERFLNTSLTKSNYMTTGSVYLSVIEKERNLKYKGKCVQVVPDVPNEIIRRIKHASEIEDADVTVIEVGGTVGEYENILFLEAARMMELKSPDDVAFVMVSFLPVPRTLGEMKTKPTQHAARTLNSAGIQPNVIIARSTVALDNVRKGKIGMFCNVSKENVISAPDVESIYDIPINFEKDNLSEILLGHLKLSSNRKEDMKEWRAFVAKSKRAKKDVRIAIVGKYFNTGEFVLSDAYISVIEAIKHASFAQGVKPVIEWLSSEEFENKKTAKKSCAKLKKYDGIIVPGAFGTRGVEGKINTIRCAREEGIPYFGLCYGMQLLVVEYARNVLGWKDASSAEFNPDSKHVVIDIMPDQKEKMEKDEYGGSMRLGAYPAEIKKGSIASTAYKKDSISERHRHRFEVNPEYIDDIETAGLVFSGTSPDKTLMEIVELPKKEHPFFVGTQFHPELKSRPLDPHPLFVDFIKAALKNKKK